MMLALASVTLPIWAAHAGAPKPGDVLTTPSGAEVTLLDVITDLPGPRGPAWRYRFVMPSLADRMPPPPEGEWDGITPEDAAELETLGMDPQDGPFDAGAFDDSGLVTLEQLQAEGAIDGDGDDHSDLQTEEASDLAALGPTIPADPDVLLQDPQHADVVWLCETIALPALPPPGDPARPAEIVITLADRPVPFGQFDPEAVQLFEGFTPSDDNTNCVWEPW